MAGTEGCQPARGSQSQKTGRSPDRSLQLDCVKSESLVIADQLAAVNTFPGLVTTPLPPMGRGSARGGSLTGKRADNNAGVRAGVEAVQGSRYGKGRLDH